MDFDEEIPTLPPDTLAILKQFEEEQQRKKEEERLGTGQISENWQLSQFWYSPETARALCREAIEALGPDGGKIAIISAPTLMQYFKEEVTNDGLVRLRLFEYDDRFRIKYPDEYIAFDYNKPLSLSEELRNSFDIVIADPPFLSDECLVKTCQTVRWLGKADLKIIFCTGAIMENMIDRLLHCRPIEFIPQHTNNLSNDFRCFVNYPTVHLK